MRRLAQVPFFQWKRATPDGDQGVPDTPSDRRATEVINSNGVGASARDPEGDDNVTTETTPTPQRVGTADCVPTELARLFACLGDDVSRMRAAIEIMDAMLAKRGVKICDAEDSLSRA